MAADEHGIDPVASDGEVDENEVQRRRKLKAEREAQEESATGMSDRNGKRGRAIDSAPDGEEEAAEMFPAGSIPGDHKVTMKNIVPANAARKTEAKMGSTAIPLRDGLVKYGELVELLVTVEAGKVAEVPDLEELESGGRRRLLGVKDVQHFRPVHVASASGVFTTDQVLDILERDFGVPRSADKIAEVFGPVTAEQRARAVAMG